MSHPATLVSWAQNAEDIRLWRVFEDVAEGFYVDVGAGDPWEGSVTKLFYDRGWSGINVEPGPVYEALALARPRDTNVRAVVGDRDGPVSFFVTYPDPGLSTVDLSAHAHVADTIERTEEITVPQLRLDSLLREEAGARRIHFLKIDVEGAERQVLASADWSRHRPLVVVVEAVKSWSTISTHDEWESILLRAEYAFAAFDGINRFYVDRAQEGLADALAYPVSALDRFVPAPMWRAQLETSRLAAKNDELQKRLDAGRERLDELTKRERRESRQIERLREELTAVYGSRALRVGRAIAHAGSPVLRVGSRLARARPVRADVTPQQAYARATRAGQPWHFPERGETVQRERSQLDAVSRVLRPFELPLDTTGASRLRDEVSRTGWSDDESLEARRLSWEERQAVVEADALGELVLTKESGSARVPARGPSGPAVVVVDVRCLQHEHFSGRGVGVHARGILRATVGAEHDARIHLLTSPELPELDADVAALGDRVITTPGVDRWSDVRLFVQLSPMTDAVGPATPFLASSSCRTAAVVYDFIPSGHPAAYLASPDAELTNRVRIEALRHYDLLLPISEATAATCRRVAGESARLVVTGVASPLHAEPAPSSRPDRYVLVPAGADARKNCAAAVAAFAYHRDRASSSLGLVVQGWLTRRQADALHELARALALPDGAVELVGTVSPRELTEMYRRASLVVVPSFAEGFSIPVAEAVIAGTPVVASDIPVHRELVGTGPWLVPPDDVDALGEAMGHVLRHRERVLERQREALGDRADADAVFERAARALSDLVATNDDTDATRAHPAHPARPRLAVLSPYPPQSSGVADYTAVTFRRVAEYADVDIYANTPVASGGTLPVGRISTAPFLDRRYDVVVSVLGNSHFHFPMLDLLTSYGGACIAHDNRMVEAYAYDRGNAWTARLLSRHRRVEKDELPGLLHDLDELPAIGYDLIARLASPLLVHSRSLARRIEDETGVAPVTVPFVPYNVPPVETIERGVRARARAALGLSDEVLHVASFGVVDRRTKGADLIVSAAAWLRGWDLPAHLHLVGAVPAPELRALEELATDLDVRGAITFHGRVPRTDFEQFLLAADVAVQIRTSATLSLSGGLADCLAFGVPTVATESLAAELDAPSFVARVPSMSSSLLVAEAIASLLERQRDDAAVEAERRAYLDQRSVDTYARALLGALGLDGRG